MMSFQRLLRDVLPVVLWLGVIFTLSTGAGGAPHTNSALDAFLARFFPEFSQGLDSSQRDALHYHLRKAAHVTEYAVLGALVVRATRPVLWGPIGRHALLAWGLCTLYAATDEFHQAFTPGRTPKMSDVLIDAAGAALGIALFRLHALRRCRLAPIQTPAR